MFFLDILSWTLIVIIISILIWQSWYKDSPNAPPGTNGLPLLGILHQMQLYPQKLFQRLAHKYGPLYMVKIAWLDVVVINDPDIAYEAYAKYDCFNDRLQSIAALTGGYGILGINHTDFHKEQRRFILNTLRYFGMGRKNLEPYILDLLHEVCSKIELSESFTNNQPFNIQTLIYKVTSQVISQLVCSQDIAKDSKVFAKILQELASPPGSTVLPSILSMAPILKHLPFFSSAWKEGLNLQKTMHSEIRKQVKEHQESVDYKNPRDYIDCFLNEIQNAKKAERADTSTTMLSSENTDDDEALKVSQTWKRYSSFSEEQLVATIRDLYLAGMDTSSATICWMILYLSKHEEVQEKIYREIEGWLGESRAVTMRAMEKLPFVRAVIQEVMRIRPLVPLSLVHLASRDAMLRGYVIPKGAVMLTNIWAIHHDDKQWPNPNKFIPERHLDAAGKFMKCSNFLPFNVGSRSCLGRQLANVEVFMAVVVLFQRFKFSLPPGEDVDMEGYSNISLKPVDFKVITTHRKTASNSSSI